MRRIPNKFSNAAVDKSGFGDIREDCRRSIEKEA
jgi:hypothetical protein